MQIALVNSFPCMPSTAEIEYIRRFRRAAERLGHRVFETVTSDDIHDCAPDFVIATHEFSPKLTPYFTLGALWSPPAFYASDPLRLRSILSYDAWLVGSDEVGRFLDDVEFSARTRKPRSDFAFLPTAPATEFRPRPAGAPYELVYAGVHWDGQRHAGLIDELAADGALALYGPASSWRGRASWRGEVPYDGVSMQETLARHGVALALHKRDHRAADTPSMRLFEAAAAGCLIITDEIPFARRVLGDSVFHIDMRDDPRANAARVREILAFANADPEAASAMARRSHDILAQDYSLEVMIERCCAFVTRAKAETLDRHKAAAFGAASVAKPEAPLVDIIIRTGGRHPDQLVRALRSIADQSVGRYRAILCDYKGRPEIARIAESEATPRLAIRYVASPDTGLRSTALWTGLRLVEAPFFAMLDDDDALMPDHFGHLLAMADAHPEHPLYYSGVVRVEEEPLDYMSAPNFAGPMDVTVAELRELKFMEPFNLTRLVAFDNYVQSNAWIARSPALDERLLADPGLVVGEDIYLYLMLARHGAFRLSPSPTAYWNWRSGSQGNSMNSVDPALWQRELDRIAIRLDQEVLADGTRFGAARMLARLLPKAPPAPAAPQRLAIGEARPLAGLVINERQAHLNPHEADGVWTAARDCTIELRIAEPLQEIEASLVFTAAGKDDHPQVVDIAINGQPLVTGPVRSWRKLEATRTLRFDRPTASIALRIRTAYTLSLAEQGRGADTRQIGLLISTLRLARPPRTASRSPALTSDGSSE